VEVNQPGSEAGHIPLSSAEVKKAGTIPPHPLRFRGMVLN
jgi:hypothetical protein